MNKKITLVLLSIFIVAVAVGAAVAAEAKTNTEIKMLSEKYEKEYMLIAKLKEENLNGNINIKIGVVQNK